MDGWMDGWVGNAWLWALVVPCLLFSRAITVVVFSFFFFFYFFKFCGCQSLVIFW
jgi:hypothetical protein